MTKHAGVCTISSFYKTSINLLFTQVSGKINSSNMTPSQTQQKLRLTDILEDLFLVLSPKEKEVIIKRFSLGDEPRQTLEKIGQSFSVTRERIRQIEKIALSKLRRTSENTKLSLIHNLGREILTAKGSVLREDILLSECLKRISSTAKTDGYISRLALHIHPDFERIEKNLEFHPFWILKPFASEDIQNICNAINSVLSKKKEVALEELLAMEVAEYLQNKGKTYSSETILSCMGIDKRFKKVPEGLGLTAWRYINPKSIRDKAYIILKKAAKPLHFVEIANRILGAGFDRKVVTVQAVHNELIRDEIFVLVGRGLYALKEWGYKKGTVAEVIEDLLRKKSPLSKQEIVSSVLKQRFVKKGTISLSLQKNPQFVRVGRAMYTLDESRK